MIRIESVHDINDDVVAELSYYGKNDYRTAKLARLFHGVIPERVWVIYVDTTPLLVFGVQSGTLLTGRTVWMLTCKKFRDNIFTLIPWMRRNVARLARKIGPLRIYVEESYVPAVRFARAVGFVPSVSQTAPDGERYILCEAG